MDDMLLNTLGGVIGYIVFAICNMIRRWHDAKQEILHQGRIAEMKPEVWSDKKKAFPQGNLVLCDGSTCYGSDSGIDCNGIYE